MITQYDETLLAIFSESCLLQLQDVERLILDLELVPASDIQESVKNIFIAAHSIKGDAGSLGLDHIVSLSHSIENILQLLRTGQIGVTSGITGLLLTSFDALRTMVLNPESRDAVPPVDLVALIAHLDAVDTEANRPAQIPAVTIAEETGTDGNGSPEREMIVDRIKTVSVSSLQLDMLVDHIGELTIAQARLARISSDFEDERLTVLSEEIQRLSSVLRSRVLGMRLVPLRVTFAKFRRMIRDLSEQLGKDVDFVLHGDETELDKSIIEELNAPLVHLLRNAMDHGIELPEVRTSRGKPPKGRISLVAEHTNNEVVFTLRDDGQGIVTDDLAKKAVEQGLIRSSEQLSNRELLDLIYHSGLTGSADLSTLSGRGMGMQAAREGIKALRGTIDVQSEKGEGTTFTIRVPVSLALLDCLHLTVGGTSFFLNIEYVEECLEYTRSASGFYHGKRTFVLRGYVYPIICLREFFTLPGNAPDRSQIVLVQAENGKIGLLVDAVVDQQQAVLKKLGRVFGRVRGIMGCSLMDDGNIAMIIDLPELVRAASENGDRRS